MVESDTFLAVGIDGGGTSCRLALAAGNRVVTVEFGPANASTDRAAAIATVREGLSALCDKAGLEAGDMERARIHAGLAGVMSADDSGAVASALPGERVVVTDDRPTTLRGALGTDDGALAAVGTGSFFGLQRRGVSRCLGGWGAQLGDETSGAWLGQRALSETLHAVDGLREPTPLTRDMLKRLGPQPWQVSAWARTAEPTAFAELAPVVVAFAEQDDALARDLMSEGAAWIERAVTALGASAEDPICLTGGLGPRYAAYLERTIVPPKGTALDGALALASELALPEAVR